MAPPAAPTAEASYMGNGGLATDARSRIDTLAYGHGAWAFREGPVADRGETLDRMDLAE